MSMLAEPRRKQKIINLRAKNNAWSNDSNKFGQRMLEKMGWSSGKGLGAKENGIVEHVVARYKNDEKGLGFEDRNDQWTKHEDDFNALLANLSNTDDNTEILHSGISLEKKSKKSKARIHYHKFTRGKDLSRYSDKDLANIFGKKSFKEKEIQEPITQDVKTSEQVFVGKGNMDEYFKKKLAAFKDKSKLCNPSTDIKDQSDYCFQGFSNSAEVESEIIANESEHQPFSFYDSKKDNPTSCQNLEFTPCPDLERSKKKKKNGSKKRDGMSRDNLEENNSVVNVQEESQDNVTEVESSKDKKSKKKKLKKKDVVIDNSNVKGEENNASECIQEERQDITEVEISKVKKSKKKKRKECLEEEIQVCEEINRKFKNRENIQDQDAYLEVNVPKKKKKAKHL